MRGKYFISDCALLLYYKCHKIDPNCGESYIDSPDWMKNKKTTIVALNHKEIGKHPKRITSTFINKYSSEGINYPSEKNDWKKFENHHLTIVSKVFYA